MAVLSFHIYFSNLDDVIPEYIIIPGEMIDTVVLVDRGTVSPLK